MLNLGSLWIELWDGSDAVLWVVTSAVVSGLLVLLLYYGRNGLERILNAGQMDRLLKLLIVYLLCLQPVLAMVFLYRGTFGYVGPPKFGDGFIHEYRHYPVSFATGFWTQLVFWLVMAVWAAPLEETGTHGGNCGRSAIPVKTVTCWNCRRSWAGNLAWRSRFPLGSAVWSGLPLRRGASGRSCFFREKNRAGRRSA